MNFLVATYTIAMKKKLKVLLLLLWVIALFLFSCSKKQLKTESLYVDIMKSELLNKEAISKSWKLLQKGQQLADGGKRIDEIIKTFPDSTIVQTNENAILFFIKGSIPMLIKLPKENDKRGKTKGGSGYAQSSTIAPPYIASTILASTFIANNEIVDVIASQKGEEDRQEKKALIIAPYLDEFGNDDDALVAKEYLEKNKNYKGRVEFKSQNLSLTDFESFGEYDLVHLSTHGARFCDRQSFVQNGQIEIVSGGDSNYCRTLILTNINSGFENESNVLDFFTNNPEYVDLVFLDVDGINLRASFFNHFYNEGVSDKIWIFSACELGQRSDLKESMERIHTNGHFFYWLNTVYEEDAKLAFENLYKNLIYEGLDVYKAFEEMPAELKEHLPSDFNDSISTTTSLIHLQTGAPRHGIEIIEMWHPEEDKMIKTNDLYPVVGDFGDGQPETLTLKVQLKGYTKIEFEEKQMTISLKIDEEVVLNKKPFLFNDDEITVENIEGHDYGLTITIVDISIPDVGEKDKLTLKAYLHINEQNFSIHKEQVTIKALGIKATMQGDGKTVVFTYDDKRKALKIESPEMPTNTYVDEQGYMYTKIPNQGWVKMRFNGMINQFSRTIPFTTSSFDNSVETTNSNLFFPIVEWATKFKMSTFEQNQNFSKQRVNCNKPTQCYKFVGTAGQELGCYAIFNAGGQLIELSFDRDNSIKYKYGEYNVYLPNARQFNIPF